MQLSWQPGFSLARKPRKRPRARHPNHSRKSDEPRRFQFVKEYPAEHGEEKQESNPESSLGWQYLPADTPEPRRHSDQGRISSFFLESRSDHEQTPEVALTPVLNLGQYGTSCGSSLAAEVTTSADDRILESCEDARSNNTRVNSEPDLLEQALLSDHSDLAGLNGSNLQSSTRNTLPSVSLSATIKYNNLHHRMQPILDRYNFEFCKIPLSTEFEANPFRYCNDSSQKLDYRLHAVMALAGHHVQSSSTKAHQHVSIQLLRSSLNKADFPIHRRPMLDAIAILFSLDETQSLFGSWKVHLAGAYNILESCGGLRGLSLLARDGAQVGIFVWWDSIVSLVSREDCIFPYHYCTALMSYLQVCQWDFFRLCGCPTELAQIVFRLARIAAEKQKSLAMQYVKFDATALVELKRQLEAWQYKTSTSAHASEEHIHQDRDRMHCSEAWRHGLLLYLYRVFEWESGNSSPAHVWSHARDIVDHVFACREDSMVSKQALLPLVFAGCELQDCSTRRKILELCNAWDARTRYHMFNEAGALLNEIWVEQEKFGVENVWWGQIVDAKHRSWSGSPIHTRICFG